MHVLVATDGSRESLTAARELQRLADPARIDAVTVVAVVSPLAAVPFANDLGRPRDPARSSLEGLSFRQEAEDAVAVVAEQLARWGPPVRRQVRSGSAAAEIVRAAEELPADLVVLASGGRGLSETVLLGSTAARVQHSAPCAVLVVRPPGPRRPGR
ncbi:universal stress protein [Desertihabitans aurantiacus]|uniref:universal stress protein n=1 Tax=Desertihabitans aurantiacus TaxID=2282477 RepID=UPI000DF800FE|nr:universal stress protein [Desertihabitans aurantiacus]